VLFFCLKNTVTFSRFHQFIIMLFTKFILRFNKPSLLTIICILIIFLVSSFIVLSNRATAYQAILIFTSWFADIATLMHFINKGESAYIFDRDHFLSYSLGLTLIKTLLGVGNLYLLYFDSTYQKWWGKVGTIFGSLIWLFVGYIRFAFTIT